MSWHLEHHKEVVLLQFMQRFELFEVICHGYDDEEVLSGVSTVWIRIKKTLIRPCRTIARKV